MKYSDQKLIELLQEAEDEIIPLTSDDFDTHNDYPAKATLTRRFGSWSEACSKAGVEFGQVTRKSILHNIETLWESGEISNSEEFFNHSDTTSAATFYKNFDCWREAVDELDIEAFTHYTDSDLLDNLNKFYDEYGYISQRKFKHDDSYPSSTTVSRRFGSWNEAVEAAGIEPNPTGVAGEQHATGRREELFGSNWYRKREDTLERDEFSCQNCGSKTDLHVHHDKPRAAYRDSDTFSVEQSNNLENLHTLCESCHYSAHGGARIAQKQHKANLSPRIA